MASIDRIVKDGAKHHYDKAKKLLEPGPRQDLETAIAELTKAIFMVENNPAYFEARGRAYLLLRDYKSAVSNFSQYLKMRKGEHNNPEVVQLQRRTSNLLVAEGLSRLQAREFGDAIHLFTAALDTDPSNVYVHVHRALARLGQQKFEDALKGFNKFLEEDGSSKKSKLPIHILVARLNKQLKNPTLAAHHVQIALEIDPDNAEALKLYIQLKGRAGELYNEATDLLLKNEPRQAIECLTLAIDLDNQDPRFLVRRGVIYRQLGQYNDAVADLENVLELTKQNDYDAKRQLAITYNQLAIELYAAQDLQQALSVYNLALKHDPDAAGVWVNRGDCYREMQEIGLALQDYLKGHELNPDDRDTRIRLSTLFDARGLTYFDRGALVEAELEFASAIKYLPTVPQYYLHRATACMESGNHAQAVKDYKQVVTLDPHNEQAWARLLSFGDVSDITDKIQAHLLAQKSKPSSTQHPSQLKQASAGRRAATTRPGVRERTKTSGIPVRTRSAEVDALVGAHKECVKEPRLPVRDRSPLRQSAEELHWLHAVSTKHTGTRTRLRRELAYKSDRRLDTRGIDGKYRDPKTGLPISSVLGLENPYPSPSLR
jgi:tetratricopeptide (TPR) repeat protein